MAGFVQNLPCMSANACRQHARSTGSVLKVHGVTPGTGGGLVCDTKGLEHTRASGVQTAPLGVAQSA